MRLAEHDLGANFGAFRGALADVVERADAIELTAGIAPADAGPPASRLPFTALAQAGTLAGEPVREFLLIPFGEVTVDRAIAGEGFTFTRLHAESVQQWFAQLGRKLAIDYEHQSFDRLNTRPDGLRPAAGWIGGLAVRDDGLWAVDVTWTERAAELLRSGEYRYFSPVIYWTDESRGDVAALGPVALTNDPAMRGVPALAARTAIRASDEDASVVELLASAEGEIDALRQELAERDADTFVDAGLVAGKIVTATRGDWREDYLRDPVAATARLARAPIVLPPGRVTGAARAPASPHADGRRAVSQNAVDSEDLAAFERASAAGRVQRAAVRESR